MGGANGSRECAADDKLRNTHQLHFVEVMGFAGLNPHTALARTAEFVEPDQADSTSPVPFAKIFLFPHPPNHL